ncbi:MAG: hypothetical protein ACON5K_09385 [Bacteroidia bacterium]
MSHSIDIEYYIPLFKKDISFDLSEDHIFFLNENANFLSNKTEIIFYKRSLYWDQRKDISINGFLIKDIFKIDPELKQLNRESCGNLLERRHRIGNNLYLPIEISNSVNIFHGHVPFPLVGTGMRESWEKVNGNWHRTDFKTTWIS